MPIRCRSRSPETIASELAATAHTREHGHHQGPTEIGQKFADDGSKRLDHRTLSGLRRRWRPKPAVPDRWRALRDLCPSGLLVELGSSFGVAVTTLDRHDARHHHPGPEWFLRDQCGGSSARPSNRAPLLRRAPVSDGGDRSRGIAAGYIAWPLDGVMVHCIGRPIISCTCSRRLAPALAGTKSRRCWWHMCPTN